MTPMQNFLAQYLRPAEHYAGLILGDRPYHLVLMPGQFVGCWEDSAAWARANSTAPTPGYGLMPVSASLPTRREQPLLFANLKEQFEPSWYWSCEQHAAYPDFAWFQYFVNGIQDGSPKSYEGRARAVRRVYLDEIL